MALQLHVADSTIQEETKLLPVQDEKFVRIHPLGDSKPFTLCNLFYTFIVISIIVGIFIVCYEIFSIKIATSLLISVNVAGITIAIFYTIKGYNVIESNKELSCCSRFLKICLMAWSKKGIYASLFTVITTEAANYALITEFYLKSYGDNNTHDINNNDINYYTLFWLSSFILIFHRFISSIIIYSFSLKYADFFLQLLDLKIFDIVYISWKYDYDQSTTIQNYISLMRLIFESTPKALISIHLLIVDDTDFIYWYSAIWSIITIVSGNIAQDTNFFKQYNHSRDIGWNTNNGCQCSWTRCCYINLRCVIRYIWRYNDVTIHLLLISYAWYFISGRFVIYNLLFEFCSLLFLSILNKSGLCCHSKELYCKCACNAPTEWNMFTGLISTFPNSTDMEGESVYRITSGAVIFVSWYRHIWNLSIAIYGIFIAKWFNSYSYNYIIQYLLLFMTILNIYLYVVVCGRYSYCICTCKCKVSQWSWPSYLGANWTVMNYYNTRSLAGVSTVKDLLTLLRFGYKLRDNAGHEGNWYWMKEPWKVAKYIRDYYPNVELHNVDFYGIGPLHLLGKNIHLKDKNEIIEAYTYFIQELKYDINQREQQWGWTPLMEAAIGRNKTQADYHKVEVLLNHGVDIFAKNHGGWTVFDYYIREDIKELLTNYL
eukprot:58510_1